MAQHGSNQPRPIIVKKVIAESHGGHHGGAWKVAYADFVTAMMAFFLLMWLIGATTEKQRKALADYFSPTLATNKTDSAGSNGLFGGDSIIAADKYPHAAKQTGTRAMTVPVDGKGGPKESTGRAGDTQRFQAMRKRLQLSISSSGNAKRLARSLRVTETLEGLRIDLIDESDFTMFASGTSILTPRAIELLDLVASSIKDVPNRIIIRGHTDSLPYSGAAVTNNWQLSAARADATRNFLSLRHVDERRISRIEGVADTQPFNPKNPYDPRNRRLSITLGWQDAYQ